MVSMAVLILTFSSGILGGMELSGGGCFPNLVWNCHWTIVTDRHSWNVSTQNAFSLPFAAILVNCAPCGEMHNYCTPQIIKENFENFLIHRCNYILLSQVYCVWQVVNTPTIILITLYLCWFNTEINVANCKDSMQTIFKNCPASISCIFLWQNFPCTISN